jgi:predicted GIY-YIG superfamily endonuclease
VYCVQHVQSHKRWIGYTKDLLKRINRHRTHPPRHMRVEFSTPMQFDNTFSVSTLFTTPCKTVAKLRERRFIKEWNTIYPQGYNVMLGNPAWNDVYWAMKRSKAK